MKLRKIIKKLKKEYKKCGFKFEIKKVNKKLFAKTGKFLDLITNDDF